MHVSKSVGAPWTKTSFQGFSVKKWTLCFGTALEYIIPPLCPFSQIRGSNYSPGDDSQCIAPKDMQASVIASYGFPHT